MAIVPTAHDDHCCSRYAGICRNLGTCRRSHDYWIGERCTPLRKIKVYPGQLVLVDINPDLDAEDFLGIVIQISVTKKFLHIFTDSNRVVRKHYRSIRHIRSGVPQEEMWEFLHENARLRGVKIVMNNNFPRYFSAGPPFRMI